MDCFIDPVFSACYREQPLVMVDIGASGGVDRRWERAARYLRVIAFEPDRRAFDALQAAAVGESRTYLNSGLHRERGTLKFHLTRKQEVSSIFLPNRRFLDRFPLAERFDVLETVDMEVDTLDSQLISCGVADVDFVKVDTQGSELFILEGASGVLGASVVGLEVEAAFTDVYDGQPLFPAVHDFLQRRGFQLFDLRPYYWKRAIGGRSGGRKGQLVFADCLYLRDVGAIETLVLGCADSGARRAKLLRLLSVCVLYGYLDYALEVLDRVGGVLDERERRVAVDRLTREVSLGALIGSFPGRGRLARAFGSLHEILATGQHGWATAAESLGNE